MHGEAAWPLKQRWLFAFVFIVGIAQIGCHANVRKPPGVPPTPTSITKEEPGGDAFNPQIAALDRLQIQGFSLRYDASSSVLVPIPDAGKWKRIRYLMFDNFTGFRYGDQGHALVAMYLSRHPQPGCSSESCLDQFEIQASSKLRRLGVQWSPAQQRRHPWEKRRIVVRIRNVSYPWFFSRKKLALAYGGYVAWKNRCAVVAYAFPMDENPEYAELVRDRFANEAFPLFRIRSPFPPVEPE
jgi:hypothetical protein